MHIKGYFIIKNSFVAEVAFNDLPDDILCNIAVYVDDTALCSKCDRASDLWQQGELATELDPDSQDTVLEKEVTCWFQCWEDSFI